MKLILIVLLPFMSGCSWLQSMDKKEVTLSQDCLMTLPDGTTLECRLEGSRHDSTEVDEKKSKHPIPGN